METLGSRLDAQRGVGSGFDFLRLFLSLGVVFWHSFAVGAGLRLDSSRFVWVGGFALLAAFFSLSGFLISGSALRLNLGNYLINRGLRIVPALALEIVLCALVLGPIFTNLSLYEYFTSGQTWRYFTNIVGVVNFHLPGVFQNNPDQTVNASVWTVPHEMICYEIFIFFALLKRPGPILLTMMAFVIGGIVLVACGCAHQTTGLGVFLSKTLVDRPARLYIFFLSGILFYTCRHNIPYTKKLFAAAVLIVILAAFLPYNSHTDTPLASLFLFAPLTYITLYIGVSKIQLPALLRKGDYSYGIYLYGWPIQQMVRTLFISHHSALMETMVSIPLIFGFAMMSWHFVEWPILQLRKRFSFVARFRLEELPEAAATLAIRATRETSLRRSAA